MWQMDVAVSHQCRWEMGKMHNSSLTAKTGCCPGKDETPDCKHVPSCCRHTLRVHTGWRDKTGINWSLYTLWTDCIKVHEEQNQQVYYCILYWHLLLVISFGDFSEKATNTNLCLIFKSHKMEADFMSKYVFLSLSLLMSSVCLLYMHE